MRKVEGKGSGGVRDGGERRRGEFQDIIMKDKRVWSDLIGAA